MTTSPTSPLARQLQRFAFPVALLCVILAIVARMLGSGTLASGLFAGAVVALVAGVLLAGISTSQSV